MARIGLQRHNKKKDNVIQGGSNMTGTDCLQFTHKKSRSYMNLLVRCCFGTHI